ncbi:monocarboxylate transporter 12-B-like [Tubulanus polymorphus]|uniref:monocarboxylate transporter 12-B-like n=1 Tax=Tubulanus polymorphus TaxID=672921 RepID=UPI003DA227CC
MKKDTGWAWMVVFASFSLRIFSYGLTTTTGILYVVFKEEFQRSSGMTSIVGSLANATSFFLGPLSSILAHRFGNRIVVMVAGFIAAVGLISSMFASSLVWLMITYGLITGLGFGLTVVPGSCVVAEYFDKKRNFAMGLASSGGGLGSFIFPPLLQALINAYGWKGAMFISGALALNVTACGAIYRPTSELRENQPNGKTSKNHVIERTNCGDKLDEKVTFLNSAAADSDGKHSVDESGLNPNTDGTSQIRTTGQTCRNRPSGQTKPKAFHGEMFTNKRFLVLCLNNVLATLGFSIIYVHLIAYAKIAAGIDPDKSAWLFTVMGSMNLFGKFGFGILANHPAISEHVLYIISLGIGGIVTVSLPLLPTKLPYLMAYASTAGLSISAIGGALLPALLVDYAGLEALSSTYGVLLITNGIGFFSGAPIAGLLFDHTGNYHTSFYLAGTVILVSSFIMLLPWRYMANDTRLMTSPEPDLTSLDLEQRQRQLSPNSKRLHLLERNFVGSVEGLDRVIVSHQDLHSIGSNEN